MKPSHKLDPFLLSRSKFQISTVSFFFYSFYVLKCIWEQSTCVLVYKSVNLQYITLGCLDNRTNESSTKSLMFQVLFFFMLSYKILFKNPFNLFSHFFYKITKIKTKSFEFLKSMRNYEKNNAWNIRCLAV